MVYDQIGYLYNKQCKCLPQQKCENSNGEMKEMMILQQALAVVISIKEKHETKDTRSWWITCGAYN